MFELIKLIDEGICVRNQFCKTRFPLLHKVDVYFYAYSRMNLAMPF